MLWWRFSGNVNCAFEARPRIDMKFDVRFAARTIHSDERILQMENYLSKRLYSRILGSQMFASDDQVSHLCS